MQGIELKNADINIAFYLENFFPKYLLIRHIVSMKIVEIDPHTSPNLGIWKTICCIRCLKLRLETNSNNIFTTHPLRNSGINSVLA